jgi:predicted Zn-dependent peptidase
VYLGGGMSSQLFQEIREKKGLAYTVYSCLTPFLDTGVFSVYAATGMNQVPLCLKLIEESAEKLKQDLLPATELKLVKENLKGTILISSDSPEARMSSIAKNEMIFGRYIGVDEILDEIDAVTPEDIRRLARELLSDYRPSLLAIGPKPPRSMRSKFRALGFK